MDSRAETSDARWLSALLRFVWGMIMWAVFLLLSPLIFLAVLVYGIHAMSPDEIGLMKVLLVVFGPFAFVLWWIIIRRVSNHCRAKCLIARRSQTGNDYSDAELHFLEHVGRARHICNFVVLLVSFAGSVYCAHLFYNSGDQQFFIGVLAGIFSPAVIIAAYSLLF